MFGSFRACPVNEHQLSKQQLLGVLVGLKETSNEQVLDEPAFLTREICDRGDIPLVRRMFAIISELVDSFDYSKSPEFVRSLSGKSDEFRAMKLRLFTPMRRTQTLKRFGDALTNVADSDAVLDLIENNRRERIKELRSLLSEVSNTNSPNERSA
jgi:hypothetical protein